MKNISRMLLYALVFALILGGTLIITAADETGTAYLPGVTVKDEHPNGCIDCHSLAGEGKDYRLNVSLTQVEKHPDITKIVKQLPGDCLMCHNEGSKSGSLNNIAHKYHYRNPGENHFVSSYQGACLNCHTLDSDSGEMKVKSGAKNW